MKCKGAEGPLTFHPFVKINLTIFYEFLLDGQNLLLTLWHSSSSYAGDTIDNDCAGVNGQPMGTTQRANIQLTIVTSTMLTHMMMMNASGKALVHWWNPQCVATHPKWWTYDGVRWWTSTVIIIKYPSGQAVEIHKNLSDWTFTNGWNVRGPSAPLHFIHLFNQHCNHTHHNPNALVPQAPARSYKIKLGLSLAGIVYG